MSNQTPIQGQASASPWHAGFPPRRVPSKRRNQKSTACENCKVKKIKVFGYSYIVIRLLALAHLLTKMNYSVPAVLRAKIAPEMASSASLTSHKMVVAE
jgi:hypothetical protein